MSYTIIDETNDREIDVDSRKDGEDKLEDFAGEVKLRLVNGDGETIDANYEGAQTASDGGTEAEIVDDTQTLEAKPEPEPQQFEGDSNDIDLDDPEAHLPGWMLTEIDHGNNTGIDLNKNGTQVVAGALGLEVSAVCEVTASETDFEYCRYRATVVRPDGRTYNGVGDCHINESGKDKWDLERQAETRAKKRAVKWAAAGGIEALNQ